MKKRMLVIAMAAIVGISAFPVTEAFAKVSITKMSRDDNSEEDEEDEEGLESDWEDPDPATELTKGDIVVTPAKKTIKVGSSFVLDLYPSDEIDEEYADLPDEEWEELLDENIDGITYRSTRSSVAYVSRSGKVKGKKKGSAVIKTTVTFRDGSEGTYKTKVYVTR